MDSYFLAILFKKRRKINEINRRGEVSKKNAPLRFGWWGIHPGRY